MRRPYPTATDQRFGLLPRAAVDLAIGPSSGGGSSGSSPVGTGPTTDSAGPASVVDVTPDTDLATLGDRVGRRVKVGGLVATLSAEGFDLDDGTAIARVVLAGDALDLLPYLRAGDAVAATGVVALVGDRVEVDVAGAADLVRVGDLGQALPLALASAPPSPLACGVGTGLAAIGSMNEEAGPAGLLVMVGVSLVSLALTALRRRQARRRLRAVVVARLATLGPIGGRA